MIAGDWAAHNQIFLDFETVLTEGQFVPVYSESFSSYNLIGMTMSPFSANRFTIGRTPRLVFGVGTRTSVAELLREAGITRVGIVTGASSLRESVAWKELLSVLKEAEIVCRDFALTGEPSPAFVDDTVHQLRESGAQAVIAIGGGSPIDAAKAAAAGFFLEGSIREYLEGVGSRNPDGRTLPVYALPTTAGTGTEATKNAVLSEIGPNGFKKSLRHDNYVPAVAIIDPELAIGCPAGVTAGSGMDAITQLIEPYVSTAAQPFTDALAESGLVAAGRCLESAVADGTDLEARTGMAYAAYLSGICLANAGLGVVHGAASPAGAVMEIPHGAFCGTLLAASVRRTIERLDDADPAHALALRKYARAGVLLSGGERGSVAANCAELVAELERLTEAVGVPRLGEFGFTADIARSVAARTDVKNHPLALDRKSIEELLLSRL